MNLLKANVAEVAEGRKAGHDVVGPLGRGTFEARVAQAAVEDVAALPVVTGDPVVVVAAQRLDTRRAGLLKRGGGADGQEIMHLADRRRKVSGRNDRADPPSGDTEGFWTAPR